MNLELEAARALTDLANPTDIAPPLHDDSLKESFSSVQLSGDEVSCSFTQYLISLCFWINYFLCVFTCLFLLICYDRKLLVKKYQAVIYTNLH